MLSEEENRDDLTLTPKLLIDAEIDVGVSVQTREIWVCDEISVNFGGWFAQVFTYFLGLSDEPVTVWLNTPGGDVESSMVFHDLVASSPVDVNIIGCGSVCSAGVLMLAAGTPGCRFVTETCTLMVHESRGFGGDDLRHSEAKDRRQWEDWLESAWCELMSRHTNKDARDWQSIVKRKAEYWRLGAKDIMDVGIADAMFTYDKLPEVARHGRHTRAFTSQLIPFRLSVKMETD